MKFICLLTRVPIQKKEQKAWELQGNTVDNLVRTQAQRYFIERGFEDAKQEAGMSQYQVRGWLAWHHHIALVMLSMLFVLTEKLEYKNEYPLLTASDVRNIIARTYAQQDNVLEIMNQRHKRRQDDIDRYYKKIKATW
jgi:hypothetical protein